jgi:hypothetical protein
VRLGHQRHQTHQEVLRQHPVLLDPAGPGWPLLLLLLLLLLLQVVV